MERPASSVRRTDSGLHCHRHASVRSSNTVVTEYCHHVVFHLPSHPVIQCQQLSQPTNGEVLVSDSEAVFTCNEGYLLVGFETITCQFGIWSHQPPTCEREAHQLFCLIFENLLLIFSDTVSSAVPPCKWKGLVWQ